MRNYQGKKGNEHYIHDHDLYMQMYYLIRSYPNLVRRRERLLYGSPPPPDGLPKGGGTSNPTEARGLVLAVVDTQIAAIDSVMAELRGKYSKTYTGELFDPYEAFMDYGVFCYFRSRKRRNIAPSRSTWARYRSEFANKVAKKLNYF